MVGLLSFKGRQANHEEILGEVVLWKQSELFDKDFHLFR